MADSSPDELWVVEIRPSSPQRMIDLSWDVHRSCPTLAAATHAAYSLGNGWETRITLYQKSGVSNAE